MFVVFVLSRSWVLGAPQTLMYYILYITNYTLPLTPYILSIEHYPFDPSPWEPFLGCYFLQKVQTYDQIY